ncbi:MAG: hypothetical protein WA989_15170 [Henriciella sp.]|uniref:hypothetical protein n=1 Tax=Henriciella sp. TaxID=1968823 RepID=UPI003C77BEDB
MTAVLQIMSRFAAVILATFCLSGAVAFGHGGDDDGHDEYAALSGDPIADLLNQDFSEGAGDGENGEFSYEGSPIDYKKFDTTPGNEAVVIQRGDDNAMTALQDGEDNLIVSVQESFGGNNFADIIQSGNYNESALLQYGDTNFYDLEQNGNNNVSMATQYGSGNVFEHVQNGDNMGFAITQYGGSAVSVTQTGN